MSRLAKYREKRQFDITSEPNGRRRPTRVHGKKSALRFFVQLHHARSRHFDFRLEWAGTLRSWAIPKGPSRDPAQKRLAVEVEDHPLDYGHFEGDIPKGQYGAGHVDLWDQGQWQPEGDVDAALKKGHLDFVLLGERLQGRWSLIRTRLSGRQPQWLLIKSDDDAAVRDDDAADDSSLRDWQTLQAKITGRRTPATTRKKTPAKRRRHDPFPRAIGLQLARLVEQAPAGADWVHEIKYDGYRFVGMRQNRRVRIVSRNGQDWTARLPSLRAALLALPCRDCIVDGELVVYDEDGHSSFDLLQNSFGNDDDESIGAVVFDLLYLDGTDLREQPQQDRQHALQTLLKDAAIPLQLSETISGDGADVAQAACQLGLEGIVCKSRSAPYREGRGGAWLKVKCVQSDEFVVVGYTTGQGARASLGSLLLARPAPDGRHWQYVGRVGSGFSDAHLAELKKRFKKSRSPVKFDTPPDRAALRGAKPVWLQPELVVEVNFRAWTRDRMLRQASLKGLRPDKSPADVARPDRAPQVETDRATSKRGHSGASGRRAPAATPYAFTHPQRLIFNEPKISKADIGALYEQIAAQILPELVERPLALLRCPDGASGTCFFQKHLTPGFRGAVHAARAKADRDAYVYIKDLDGLLALVQMNVVEIHAWGSRLPHPQRPDHIVFDLDPAADVRWRDVKRAATDIRDRLAALQLESFLRTSGGKGLHVVVPLSGDDGWDDVKAFSHAIVTTMAQDEPTRYVDVASKARRKGRIFIDYLRNARGATSVASYSLRARPGAPIAAPIAWSELPRLRSAAQYHFGNIRARIARHPDPWKGINDVEQALPRA